MADEVDLEGSSKRFYSTSRFKENRKYCRSRKRVVIVEVIKMVDFCVIDDDAIYCEILLMVYS